jgi:ABC-2 type transport system ATP-binding protein
VALAEPAIETRDLTKSYRSKTALAGLTMRVERGSAFGFLGPNGAGKTTAIKVLLGLVRPTSGEATVLGAPAGDRDVRRKIGYLPELFRYQEWMTAREVLNLHARLVGVPRARREPEIATILERVGLAARGNDRLGGFSKGMQQRLGLGVALVGEPALVFLDEPTSALDPVGRNDVRELVRSLTAAGTTVFLNSHLLGEVERSCDHVAIVSAGGIVADGSIDELVGKATAVRLRATPLERAEPVIRARGGETTGEDWFVVRGIAASDVPRLVAELVGAGVAVHAVEPARATLEERFLEVLGDWNAGSHDRVAQRS